MEYIILYLVCFNSIMVMVGVFWSFYVNKEIGDLWRNFKHYQLEIKNIKPKGKNENEKRKTITL